MLTSGPAKHPDPPSPDRGQSPLYLAQLNLRLGDGPEGQRLVARGDAIRLTGPDARDVANVLQHDRQLLDESSHSRAG